MTKNNEQIEKLYICDYGQSALPICVDLGHEYCKLESQKAKECNLRPVVSYDDYKRKEQECEELTSKCSQLEEEIKDWQKEVERVQFIGSYGIMDEVKKNTQLKQTLAEIKEIAEENSELLQGYHKEWANNKLILEIINEVEE